jgi:excisionase family DNA binding protein
VSGPIVDLRAEDLLDAKAAAEILGVEPRTVTAWAREGRLPCLRLGPKTVRWTRAMLAEWAASKFDPGRGR